MTPQCPIEQALGIEASIREMPWIWSPVVEQAEHWVERAVLVDVAWFDGAGLVAGQRRCRSRDQLRASFFAMVMQRAW